MPFIIVATLLQCYLYPGAIKYAIVLGDIIILVNFIISYWAYVSLTTFLLTGPGSLLCLPLWKKEHLVIVPV